MDEGALAAAGWGYEGILCEPCAVLFQKGEVNITGLCLTRWGEARSEARASFDNERLSKSEVLAFRVEKLRLRLSYIKRDNQAQTRADS